MAATPGKPSSGPLLFDVNEVEDAHADDANEVEDAHADDQDNTVPRRGEQAQPEQERSGHAQIKAWLDKLTARSIPGEELGEPPDLHALIMDGTITLDDLRQYEHELKAAMDALHIARAKFEHDRDTQIMMIADKVVTAARRTGDAKLLEAYEQTIKYSREVAKARAKQAAQEVERERIARGR